MPRGAWAAFATCFPALVQVSFDPSWPRASGYWEASPVWLAQAAEAWPALERMWTKDIAREDLEALVCARAPAAHVLEVMVHPAFYRGVEGFALDDLREWRSRGVSVIPEPSALRNIHFDHYDPKEWAEELGYEEDE